VNRIFQYIQSFTVIGLVLAGISGVAYNLFREGGWLGSILGGLWNILMEHSILVLLVISAVLFIGKMWYDHNRATGRKSKLPDALVYVVMGAGVYFVWKLFAHGTF
jgi:hypothetical protein